MSVREDLAASVAGWLRVTQDLRVYVVLSYATEVLSYSEFSDSGYEIQTVIAYTESMAGPVKLFRYGGPFEELLDEL